MTGREQKEVLCAQLIKTAPHVPNCVVPQGAALPGLKTPGPHDRHASLPERAFYHLNSEGLSRTSMAGTELLFLNPSPLPPGRVLGCNSHSPLQLIVIM